MLAIPHNGNLSNGLMFSVETNDGKPLTKELAALRAALARGATFTNFTNVDTFITQWVVV